MRLCGVGVALFAVIALSIAAAAGAFGGNGGPVRGAAPPPSPAELRVLAQDALEAASSAGDPHPIAAFVVPTTRHIAERVSAGDDSEARTPAYFVLIQGHFTSDFSVPEGSKAPTGKILTLTVDPRRNLVLDNGVGNRMPYLYAMGQPEQVPLPARAGG